MPILNITITVAEEDNADIARSMIVAAANGLMEEIEPDAFDDENTVTYEVNDD